MSSTGVQNGPLRSNVLPCQLQPSYQVVAAGLGSTTARGTRFGHASDAITYTTTTMRTTSSASRARDLLPIAFPPPGRPPGHVVATTLREPGDGPAAILDLSARICASWRAMASPPEPAAVRSCSSCSCSAWWRRRVATTARRASDTTAERAIPSPCGSATSPTSRTPPGSSATSAGTSRTTSATTSPSRRAASTPAPRPSRRCSPRRSTSPSSDPTRPSTPSPSPTARPSASCPAARRAAPSSSCARASTRPRTSRA